MSSDSNIDKKVDEDVDDDAMEQSKEEARFCPLNRWGLHGSRHGQ